MREHTIHPALGKAMTWGLHELGEVPGTPGQPRGAWVVFGGQAGSEGKGAIAGYLARKYRWGAAICNFMTNAGHTWQDGNEKVVVQQIPMAVVSENVERLLIGPGAAITLAQLEKELQELAPYNVEARLTIHPRAMIIDEQDPAWEAENLRYIASTGKGCGAALGRKIMRSQDVRLARDVYDLRRFIGDTTKIANDIINGGKGLLVEGAQGFDLDVNHGIEYPYCTSRGTTPMAVLADCGIDGRMVERNIAVVRSHPIRVGNVEGGTSGPFGESELSWDEVSHRAGRAVEERTTVTQRVRRIFEIDLARLRLMSTVCRPTDIAYTFADYVDASVQGWDTRTWMQNPGTKAHKAVWEVEQAMKRGTASPRVSLIKTGPSDSEIIDFTGPAD